MNCPSKICPLCDTILTKFELVNKNYTGFTCGKCYENNNLYHLIMNNLSAKELAFALDGYEVIFNFSENKTYVKNYNKYIQNEIIMNIDGIIDFDFSNREAIKEKIDQIFFTENFV